MSGKDKKQGGSQQSGGTQQMPMETMAPFMPGFDQMIAQQLAQGFGGAPQTYSNAFSKTYAPMQVPDYSNWQGAPVPAAQPQPAPQANAGGPITIRKDNGWYFQGDTWKHPEIAPNGLGRG